MFERFKTNITQCIKFRDFSDKIMLKWASFWLFGGTVIRLMITIGSGWRIDFDEAFNGLLAFHILAGDWVFFTPPEVVGGTGTPYLLAVIFSVLGSSAITFRLLSLLWSGLYIVSTGWLAHLAYGKRIGILAMGFAAFAPPYMQFIGMKLWSSYIETILLGNLLFIAVYYLLQHITARQTVYWMLLCGLVAGVMFWLTWLGFYYYIPVGLILLWKGRRQLIRWGWVGILAFVVGSLPFWIFNIPRGMPTFVRVMSDAPMTIDQIMRVLGDLITIQFPMLVSGHPAWGYNAAGLAIFMVIVYAIGLLMIIRRSKSREPLPIMLAILVFSVPVLYAISTHSRNALPEFNPWGIDATGRYVLMFHTVLPIGMALLTHRIWKWKSTIGIGLFIGVIALNIGGTLAINFERAFDSPYYDRLPRDLSPLIDFLDQRDIHHAWVDGGIGHVLMFLTEVRVVTEDYRSVFLADGFVRQPDVLMQIQAATPTVFITPIYAGQEHPPLQQALDSLAIPYEMVRVTPEIAVYMIEGNFDPQQVASGLGYQY